MADFGFSNIILSNLYIVISFIVMIVDGLCAFHAYMERKNYSFILALTGGFAGLVQLTYLLSIICVNYFWVSLYSSIYFLSVDFTVLTFWIFMKHNGPQKDRKWNKGFLAAVILYQIVDIGLFITNLFNEIMVHYQYQGGVMGIYQYDRTPLYWMHLIYTYLLVILTLRELIKSAFSIPKEYRVPFYRSVVCILAVVGLNALFLYFPDLFGDNNLDYSIWGYSLAAFMIYYLFFRYPLNGMQAYYHNWIVQNINQGVVLFNYEGNLIIHNEKIHQLFPDCSIDIGDTILEFSKQLNLKIIEERSNEDYEFQYYISRDGKEHPLRFEHRCLFSNTGDQLGQLFVFTEEKSELDLLTAFHNWDYFKQELKENTELFGRTTTVSVCDLNGLQDINKKYGRSVGDHAIEYTAQVIRKHFTGESYFIRGEEANLIVISFELDRLQVAEKLENIRIDLLLQTELDCVLYLQSAVGDMSSSDTDLLSLIEQAVQSMHNKKLLDTWSKRSELVTSLVKALSECDPETEEHVKRTQILGEKLGKRIGLTDMQMSDLALLCIMHDIGKIGIPLEILNKPGKLTEDEWNIMRKHTIKGYQIANSSKELSHIADMILHHHERWDGNGYPDGLTKESIPLLSRIIAVVDAYDAMVNKRPYRNALSRSTALKELKQCAGTQFDPGIVNEFIQLIPELAEAEPEPESEEKSDAEAKLVQIIQEETVQGTQVTGKTEHVRRGGQLVGYSRYLLDEKGQIFKIDKEFEKLTGYTKEDVDSKRLQHIDLIPEEDKAEFVRVMIEASNNIDTSILEHRLQKKDGSIIYVFCLYKHYYEVTEQKERVEMTVFDISNTYSMQVMMRREHVKAETRLARWEEKYRCDSLTGLLNQEAFKNDIDYYLLDENLKIAFLMIDVDHFKEYNDTFGHREGDEFLIRLSQDLNLNLNKDDLACRMGGDEFALALFSEKSDSDESIIERTEKICDTLNMILASRKGNTGVSMGVAISDSKINTFNKLYELADQALYEAKEEGRGRMKVRKL